MSMIYAGVDAGSRAIKIVVLDNRGRVLAKGVADQVVRQAVAAKGLMRQVLTESGIPLKDVTATVATGYGRDKVAFADRTITEITCHAAGVRSEYPDTRTIIDIGGQDSKLIRLVDGHVQDFAMNDRCAAGTGRFLEIVSKRLEVDWKGLAREVRKSHHPCAISSTCVVFAESEIIGLLAEGVKRGNIIAGVQKALATRIRGMAGRRIDAPVVFTGGVALVPGMRNALQKALGCRVTTARDPQFTGALGAALLAREGGV